MGVEEHSLDELARGLASGSVSRRKALKVMGGVLVGTVLGSVPGIALTQRAAEAALSACRNASACCACTYEEGGGITGSTCFKEVGHRCEGRRIQSFRSQCEERCFANAPPTADIVIDFDCEEVRGLERVCRQRESGEKHCGQRSC
jgi:hypothetical protein